METDSSSNETGTSFSYDILDAEAAKISSLVALVQEKCSRANSVTIALELFAWAEECALQGKSVEAEFLYLHAINKVPRKEMSYPIAFSSLREFTYSLLDVAKERSVELSNVTPILDTASRIGSNAA